MTNSNWMIYGANGYSGRLIAEEAVRRGWRPTLAGRNKKAISKLAADLGDLPFVAFDICNRKTAAKHLAEHELLLNCAGPFSATAQSAIHACLDATTHYLDITGEIDVFEFAHSAAINERAKAAGVVICPGVGFDVIPTDCVAAQLKTAMPDATHLTLGFDSRSGFSPGTAKTSVEGLAAGGKIREDGIVITVPHAYNTRTIDYGSGAKLSMTIPWGDVSTAFFSTAIPNIEVYIPSSPKMIKQMRRLRFLSPAFGFTPLRKLVQSRIGKTVKGPDADSRSKLTTLVWGEARNLSGKTISARIRTANGYDLTVNGSLHIVHFLRKNSNAGGSYTPSLLVGQDLITQLPGSGPMSIG